MAFFRIGYFAGPEKATYCLRDENQVKSGIFLPPVTTTCSIFLTSTFKEYIFWSKKNTRKTLSNLLSGLQLSKIVTAIFQQFASQRSDLPALL